MSMEKPIIDINEFAIKKLVESLRPEDIKIREQLDIGYSFDGTTFLLYEIRPVWGDPKTIQHLEFAKIKYYKAKNSWKLYWMRASGKWESFEPFPESTYLEKMIEVIKTDKHGCFFG